MRLATWNVNSLRVRQPRVEAWLAEVQPDIVCMQETKLADSSFPALAFEALGYTAAHHGQGQWNGVAVLSRVGIDDVGGRLRRRRSTGPGRPAALGHVCRHPDQLRVRPERAGSRPRALPLQARLAGPAPAPPRGYRERGPARRRGRRLQHRSTDDDVYDAAKFVDQTHTSPPERAALAEIEAWGLEDVFRRHVSAPKCFSWWDYRAGDFHQGRGMRIDLVLASAPVAAATRWCIIDRNARKGQQPSDHAPLVVDLDWP